MNLNSKENNPEFLARIINGAISYNEASNPDFSEEDLNSIISYLDSNSILDAGSWSDLISIDKSMKF